jgi:hypothetical protein
MIYEKRLGFGMKNVICENDNIIWNYVWLYAKAQLLGGDYAPNTLMLGMGGNKVA